ncbi:MAG: hypothetical protein P8M22_07660 [Phycisphaerales bacterium]|nr:hypothetical protein [Phycisphaerales bacterium]
MTFPDDDRLKSAWQNRQKGTSSVTGDVTEVAAWLDQGCPESDSIDLMLAENRSLREAVGAIRLEQPDASTQFVSKDTHDRLLAAVLETLPSHAAARARPPVIGSIGLRITAAAAAIVVAALGFNFGRVAAPATNQATSDFVTVVTFDMLSDDDNLNSILMTSSVAIDVVSEGDEQ